MSSRCSSRTQSSFAATRLESEECADGSNSRRKDWSNSAHDGRRRGSGTCRGGRGLSQAAAAVAARVYCVSRNTLQTLGTDLSQRRRRRRSRDDDRSVRRCAGACVADTVGVSADTPRAVACLSCAFPASCGNSSRIGTDLCDLCVGAYAASRGRRAGIARFARVGVGSSGGKAVDARGGQGGPATR